MTSALATLSTRAAALAARARALALVKPLVTIGIAGVVVGSGASLVLGSRGGAAANGQPTAILPLFACPDGKTQVGDVQPGEQVLVTGRTDDGAWLQLHFPSGGALDRAWAQTAAFQLDGAFTSLPTASCSPAQNNVFGPAASLTLTAKNSPSPAPTRRPTPAPLPTAQPTPEPTPEPTPRPNATPTPRPTPKPTPTPTPAPTPTPGDTTPPVVLQLLADPTTIGDGGAPVACNTKEATISALVTDAVGVFSVTVWYDPPGTQGSTALPMTRVSGTTTNGTWTAKLSTIGTSWPTGTLTYFVRAFDAAGNTTRYPAGTGTSSITLVVGNPC